MSHQVVVNKLENYGTIYFGTTAVGDLEDNSKKTNVIQQTNKNAELLLKETEEKLQSVLEQKEVLKTRVFELKQANEELLHLLQQKVPQKAEKSEVKTEDVFEPKLVECIMKNTEDDHNTHMHQMEVEEDGCSENVCLPEPGKCSSELFEAFQQISKLTAQQDNPPLVDLSNMLVGNLNQSELDMLCKWSNKQTLHVLFKSTETKFTRENCLKLFNNSHDLIILIETQSGEIFGSYHHDLPQTYGVWVTDPRHFVFSLRNLQDVPGKYDAEPTNKYSLMIADFIDDDDELKTPVLEVGYFYSLTFEEMCSFNPSFKTSYKNTPKGGVDFILKNSASAPVKTIWVLQ
ncbi:hypothetical protein EIN_430200 [Entamoeba invadens IP1]|uniref:TLDc domain-containing protein n=1 Tax=Entamoeba invadens IP1 TaxID=370355 RepID=A0A0A1UGW5_ENTIV|nr:hypothetical protein EIN_430200 [Entamoeba invadens IP1]ELP95224.1 hypothetical protein EIN_430200 [Entamoeba invadens IP1]|eukprot:XP_004261995.1 hypothetical protein EIN_430200 [Entamoeba invadens IP1]